MDTADTIRLALDPTHILRAQGLTPDPWQVDALLCPSHQVLLNCCRGAGKSRVTSAKAVHTALFRPASLTLLISRAQRQAQELYRYVRQAFRALGWPVKPTQETETKIELANGSRIVSLPGKEATIRSFQGVDLLVIDEAAKVADDLYAAVSPMTAISKGQQWLLSTPFGQRGFFWREWHDERAAWTRFRIPWQRCPRHAASFIEEERRKFGDAWIEQEYECSFVALEGLVYPDFGQCITDFWPRETGGRWCGGIDWGWNNPFAALWCYLTNDDVLHVLAERYLRQTALAEHVAALRRPKKASLPAGNRFLWYADPSGPTEINECRSAGLKVLRGNNDIRAGIQAVASRIRTERLKIYRPACPRLINEGSLYRYPSPAERHIAGEEPIDAHNHALGALRYLISKLDHRFIARMKHARPMGDHPPEPAGESVSDPTPFDETAAAVFSIPPKDRPYDPHNDEELWTRL